MKERFYSWLALFLPRRLVYWCVIRAGAFATMGKYSSTEVLSLTLIEVLDRWEKK